MNSFREVIAAFGGPAKMAALLNDPTVNDNLVRQWNNRDSIPAEYWSAAVEKAAAASIDGVTLAAFAQFAASRKVGKAAPTEGAAPGADQGARTTARKAA